MILPKPVRQPRARRKRIRARRTGSFASMKREADRLCSLYVKSRDRWRCVNCGSTEYPQWAHGFSRSYLTVRHDEENSWCLCRRCHFRFTKRPLEWEDFMRARLGERYDLLRARALTYARPDLSAVIVVYRAKLDQMEVPWKK